MAVDLHADHAIRLRFKLKPRPLVRNDLRTEELLTAIAVRNEVHAGRTDKLGNDHTLDTVDNKRPALRHHGEIAEIYLLNLFVASLCVYELHRHAKSRLVRKVLKLGVFFVALRLVESKIGKVEL